jgi:predicted dehydrogenase
MNKIKSGIIGLGYISFSHMDAVRRTGMAEISACVDLDYNLAQRKAEEFNIPKCYPDVDSLLADPEIEVIHNCTPNYLHKEVNEKIIKAGKHLYSEKPLARNSKESSELLELQKQYPKTVTAVNFNYRMNPLVQDMRLKISSGQIGKPRVVHGSYLQDWLLFETDYNWRLDSKISGISNTIADIGSHWIDSVQVVTGEKITSVCANLVTNIPVRKKAKGQVEAFAVNESADYEDVEIDTEDWGAVLFKMSGGINGVFHVSQVSAGRKCFLNFEINGEKASMYWNQEVADQMWIGNRDEPNSLVLRNPNLMSPDIRKYTYLAAGHPEGWNDAMTNNVKAFYRHITERKSNTISGNDFATFEEAHYIIKVVEAIVESSRRRQWVDIS